MKKTYAFILILIAGYAYLQSDETTSTPTVNQLLHNAEKAVAVINDYTATMIKQERFKNGKTTNHIMQIKFARPFKVYLKFLEPYKGREIIYVEDWNKNKLRVHKGSFPDLTLNLNPQGNTAMKNNHHPITHTGIENLIHLAAKNYNEAQKRQEGTFTVSDGGKVAEHSTWKIVGVFPECGIQEKVGRKETVWDVAERTSQDAFVIIYNNKNIDKPDDVDEGDMLFVPRYYAAKVEFYLDKELMLPVQLNIYDNKGNLYEHYEYRDLKINPGLTEKDFDPDNPNYNF